jgi:hypothetical protein
MPETLIIEAREDTPKVIFDVTNRLFEISTRSLPENAIGFYEPVLQWLNEYSNTPLDLTVFDFKLEYFNTASAKQLAKILLILENIAKQSKVVINWYYKKEDTDMLASGTRFSKLIDLNFNLIEY